MKSRFLSLLGDQRGQAMVEYSTITFMLLIGIAGAGFALPAKAFGQQVPLAQALYSALQVHVDSYYFSLHLLAP